MKLALIVLLGFCAIAAQGSQYTALEESIPEGPLLDGIKETIEKALAFAKDTINKLLAKIKDLAEKIKNSISPKAKEILDKIITIIKKIAEIAKTGIIAKSCAEKHADKIEELLGQMNAEIEVCQNAAMEEVQVIQEEIMEAVSIIQGCIGEMYTAITECIDSEENALNKALCIGKKIFVIRDKIKTAYEAAESIIAKVQEKVPAIVDTAQTCMAAAQEEPMKELNDIVRDIQKCIMQNQK